MLQRRETLLNNANLKFSFYLTEDNKIKIIQRPKYVTKLKLQLISYNLLNMIKKYIIIF